MKRKIIAAFAVALFSVTSVAVMAAPAQAVFSWNERR